MSRSSRKTILHDHTECHLSVMTELLNPTAKSRICPKINYHILISWAECRGRKTTSACRHCRPKRFCASGKFPDSLERFPTVEKMSGQSGKFSDNHVLNLLFSFKTVWNNLCTFVYVVKTIYALSAHVTEEEKLCTWSRKFLRIKVCRPES